VDNKAKFVDAASDTTMPYTGIGVKECCFKLNGTVMIHDAEELAQLLSSMESMQVRSYFNAVRVDVGWEVRFYL